MTITDLGGHRISRPIPCWLCGEVATHEVEDTDTGETLLTCDKHETAAFS